MVLYASFVGAAMGEVAALPEPGLKGSCARDGRRDSAPLVRMSEWIRKDRLDVRSLLIVKDGKLIFERYAAASAATTITNSTRSPRRSPR